MTKKKTCIDCGKQFLPKYNHIERCNECEEIYRKQKLTIGQVLILQGMEQKIEEQRVRDGYYQQHVAISVKGRTNMQKRWQGNRHRACRLMHKTFNSKYWRRISEHRT